MPTVTNIRIEGAAKSLRILDNIDKQVAKDIRRELKAAAEPIVTDARKLVPTRPLSGWGRWIDSRTGRDLSFNANVVKRRISITQRTSREKIGSFIDPTGTKRNRYTKTIAFLEVRNNSAAGHIFELAGARQPGSQFNRAIMARYGPPKRLIHKTGERHRPRVERDVAAAVDRLEREVTKRLAR